MESRASASIACLWRMAVHIDRTLLVKHPHFPERYWRATVTGDSNSLEFLSYRLKNAPMRGQNRYHAQWFPFAMLDEFELLNKEMTNMKILDIYRSIPREHALKPIDDEYCRFSLLKC